MKRKHFTFGFGHVSTHPLPRGGRLGDYYVTIVAAHSHRELFIEMFTNVYCPNPMQFAFEYDEKSFDASYCPKGELKKIMIIETVSEPVDAQT